MNHNNDVLRVFLDKTTNLSIVLNHCEINLFADHTLIHMCGRNKLDLMKLMKVDLKFVEKLLNNINQFKL